MTTTKFFRFAKTWVFAVMMVSFVSCIYAHYFTNTGFMTFGTVAALSSMFYVALVIEEIRSKGPIFKYDDNGADKL